MRIKFREKDGLFTVCFFRNRRAVYAYRGKDERKARRIFAEYEEDFKRVGNTALLLSPGQRADAMSALRLLRGHAEVSLTDLAREFVRSAGPGGEDLFSESVEWFLEECRERELRQNTIKEYQWHLRRVGKEFAGLRLREVEGPDVLEFLRGLQVSALTKGNYYRSLHVFFEACRIADPPRIAANPMQGISRRLPKVRRRSAVGFLSLKQCRRFLRGAVKAAPESVGMFALLMFTGVRQSEFRRVPGRVVDVEERMVDIPEEFSKNGQPRLIEGAPGCMWDWLKEYPVDPDAPIVPAKHVYRQRFEAARTAAGIKAGDWPANAFRHGFASYFYAATGRNIGLVLEVMGHEGGSRLFHARYKGRVTEAQGRKFVALSPKKVLKGKEEE